MLKLKSYIATCSAFHLTLIPVLCAIPFSFCYLFLGTQYNSIASFHIVFTINLANAVRALHDPNSKSQHISKHLFVLDHLLSLLFTTIMVTDLAYTYSHLWWGVLVVQVIFSMWNIPFVLVSPNVSHNMQCSMTRWTLKLTLIPLIVAVLLTFIFLLLGSGFPPIATFYLVLSLNLYTATRGLCDPNTPSKHLRSYRYNFMLSHLLIVLVTTMMIADFAHIYSNLWWGALAIPVIFSTWTIPAILLSTRELKNVTIDET